MHTGRGGGWLALVLPRLVIVVMLLLDEAGKNPIKIFRILKLGMNQGRGIRIGLDILLEIGLVLDDIVNQATQEDDIRTRTDADILIRKRRGAGKVRVDMDDLGAPLTRFQHKAKTDRVI